MGIVGVKSTSTCSNSFAHDSFKRAAALDGANVLGCRHFRTRIEVRQDIRAELMSRLHMRKHDGSGFTKENRPRGRHQALRVRDPNAHDCRAHLLRSSSGLFYGHVDFRVDTVEIEVLRQTDSDIGSAA